MNETPAPVEKASLAHRLYHGETTFDFVGRRKVWFVFSAVVVLAGLLSLGTQGLNLGIDFEGGTSWEVPAPGVSVSEARDAVRPLGLGDATIQIIGDDRVRVASDNVTPEEQERISQALAEVAGASIDQVSVNDVGPSWGQAVTNKARNALVVFFVLISIYISLRFEWKMAVAALAAVVHDIFVTVGVYSISRFEVTPATVVAFLTILGYSLYDTIVVFDKVEENTKGLAASGRFTYSDTVNLSMNQVLMRSLNATITSLLPVLSMLFIGSFVLGAVTLQEFAVALAIGLVIGAYSSIFVAAPVVAWLKEREPQWRSTRTRLATQGGRRADEPVVAGTGARSASAPIGVGPELSGRTIPPRPRKKGKRR
jgi:preprotein translocase subunit SecF